MARPSEVHERSSHPVFPYLIAGGLYLLLSLIVWAHVWTGHPTSTTTCGCGDSSTSIWFTAWPPYAITHGLNPLYSTTVGYPTGINLIFASYGIVLAPITWLFGSVAGLNVGLTLSPVLSALAMFALVRRWVPWAPAAFVSGLFYGFSPFVLSNLSVAHLDFGMVAIPPLVIICLDELLIRQRRRPVATGIVLGLLICLQFFIGLEVLLLMFIEIAVGLVIVVVYATKRDPVALREHARPAAVGIVAAAVTALVLLIYPAWYGLAGPAHFSQVVHPGLHLNSYMASLVDFLIPSSAGDQWQRIVGGYQGPVLNAMYFSQYFGVGVFAVCGAGLVIWRRDRLLWFFGGLALATFLLAMASGPFLAALPFVDDIEPLHFVLFAYLTVAVVLGVVVDRVRVSVNWRVGVGASTARPGPSTGRGKPSARWAGALVALVVAAVAIVFPGVSLAKTIPLTVQPVVLPTWFRTVAPRLPGHPVVLALPAPFTVTKPGLAWRADNGHRYPFAIGWKQAALTWQALGGQRTSIVGSGGLGAGLHHRAGENQGQTVITEVTFAYGSMPVVTSSDIAAVHRALSEWGVTMVVLPDQPELPAYDQVASVTAMAGLIAAATGAQPVHVADAWVWRGVDTDVPARFPSATSYARCTAGLPNRGAVAVERTVSCVLAAGG